MPTWRNGRRAAFRSQSVYAGEGSSPFVGTNLIRHSSPVFPEGIFCIGGEDSEMNIFVLDRSPRTAAEFLCDVHVVKMILESAQLLSTQDRLSGLNRGYEITHANHPCRRCLENPANYLWLSAHLGALLREYSRRYRRMHKTEPLYRMYWMRDFRCMSGGSFAGKLTFPKCMPEEYRVGNDGIDDVVASYRSYYRFKQRSLRRFRYTNRTLPEWLAPL